MRLEELFSIIEERKKLQPKGSYVASLLRQGEDKILQKVGEETTEVIIVAKGKNKKRIIEEVADLVFMILILLAAKRISLQEVFDELERRKKKFIVVTSLE